MFNLAWTIEYYIIVMKTGHLKFIKHNNNFNIKIIIDNELIKIKIYISYYLSE